MPLKNTFLPLLSSAFMVQCSNHFRDLTRAFSWTPHSFSLLDFVSKPTYPMMVSGVVGGFSLLLKSAPRTTFTLLEEGLCIVGLLTLGVAHGAMDAWWFTQLELQDTWVSSSSSSSSSWWPFVNTVGFFTFYLGFMGLHAWLWWMSSGWGWGLFIAMSVHHFGISDTSPTMTTPTFTLHGLWKAWLRGGVVVSTLMVLSPTSVLMQLIPSWVEQGFVSWLQCLYPGLLGVYVLNLKRVQETWDGLAWIVLMSTCHVYVGFTVYFTLLHALPTLVLCQQHWCQSVPYTLVLGAVMVVGYMYQVHHQEVDALTQMWVIFIYVISVVTTPHVVFTEFRKWKMRNKREKGSWFIN
ncbi:hypothetical protein HMI54_009126 [Coelomomyces lativittatus]|nr:hypothetical protein HMI55_001566 [Coelomomyces lativittatus]KAJ1508695.1 hypothetical protein HMI56_007165 [Coelomomyces lativittatus]KAJ1516526.1 hypothetical protein HMI54_009126 [Coelomomyces lativittatus]